MKYRTVLLFGAPGSGKGTQGRVLAAVPGYFYFACGDAFRNLRPDDPVGKIFFEYSSRGLLVPDETTVDLWASHLEAGIEAGRFDPAAQTLILDGIPRNVRQAEIMESRLNVKAVLHLTCVDPGVLVGRLQGRAAKENRTDDTKLEVIRKRLETYERETRPVLDFYGTALAHDIECNQTPLMVLRDVVNVLAGIEKA